MTDDDRAEPVDGTQTHGMVRIGDRLLRRAHARTAYVQGVLAHLRHVGFEGAPRPFGTVVHEGREMEVVEFVPGVVPSYPFELDDAQRVSGARLTARLLAAAATYPGLAPGEVVCHGDLGPHNTVLRGDRAVAVIDWDDGVAPGPRISDVAHAVWGWADLAEDHVTSVEQRRRAALVCDELGVSPREVVHELGERFRRARTQHLHAGRDEGAAVFARLVAWAEREGPRFPG